MLFSEPKIPQYYVWNAVFGAIGAFSALQRAENSSIEPEHLDCRPPARLSVLFSEPKIPQCLRNQSLVGQTVCFQCSSASRKFLNALLVEAFPGRVETFSALQRAENSSIVSSTRSARRLNILSVLFSEPKIPQFER